MIAKAMKYTMALVLSILVVACDLRGKYNTSSESSQALDTARWLGYFVSSGYYNRSDNADWGVVMIDTLEGLRLRVRYRADIKEPSYTYDQIYCNLSPNGDSLLTHESVCASLRGDTLDVSNLEPDNGITTKQYIRLRDSLDATQLVPVLHTPFVDTLSVVYPYILSQQGKELIILTKGAGEWRTTLHNQYIYSTECQDLDGDGDRELIVQLADFRIHSFCSNSTSYSLLVFSRNVRGIPYLVPLEDFRSKGYANGYRDVDGIYLSDSGKLFRSFPISELRFSEHQDETIQNFRYIEYQLVRDTPGKRLVIKRVWEEEMRESICSL